MTKISDEDLIEKIREAVSEGDLLVSWNLADQAADRIEELVKEVDRRIEPEQVEDLIKLAEPIMAELYGVECSYREAAEAKLAKCLEQNALLEARLSKAVKLIGYAIELGRFELNPKLLDDLIHFKTEIELEKTE